MKTREDRGAFETREDIRILNYNGEDLGKITVKTEPFKSEQETRDLIREMSPSQKINMKERAYPVYRLCEMFEITPEQYLFAEDIMIYIANRGYKNLTEVVHNDPKVAGLIKQMELEGEVFNDFTPQTHLELNQNLATVV